MTLQPGERVPHPVLCMLQWLPTLNMAIQPLAASRQLPNKIRLYTFARYVSMPCKNAQHMGV